MAKTIKSLNSIAIPLIIQSIFNVLMGIADQSISGRLSPEYYNSVSVISRFFNTIFGILGCVVILLHIKGSRLTHNRDKLIKLFNQYLVTEFLIGLLFTLAFLIFGKSILSFMLGKTVFDVTNIIKYYYFYSLCTIVQLLGSKSNHLYTCVKKRFIWVKLKRFFCVGNQRYFNRKHTSYSS